MQSSDAGVLKPILSKHFRAMRAIRNDSQDTMSETLHISPRAYANLEQGKSLCSTPVLFRYLGHCCTPQQRTDLVESVVTALLAHDQSE